jgi:outer membrane protein W
MIYKYLPVIFLLTTFSFAQYNGKDFSIAVNGVYTTTAKIYLTPNSSDPVLRNNSFPLEDILNPSIDFRYRLTNQLLVGLNTEYMVASAMGSNLTVFTGNNTERITIEDGFKLIPIELSLHYLIPFSTESFKFLMGAGFGYYIGEHLRKIGDAEALISSRKIAYGIHVSISLDYLLKDNISIRTEMKFRDPQFSVTSIYNKNTATYNGRTIRLAQDSFDSKINVDGVTFIIGGAFHF